MSGHSKWATIKRKKAAIDAKRGKAFTRLLREIQVAAKLGGGNLEGNPRLKSAVTATKAESVPGDNIERAIKRGTGDMEGVNYEEVTYEGYGPAGVAVIVQVLTDNKNRTAADVRSMFTRAGGNLAGNNAVAFQFTEKAVLSVSKDAASEEKVFEVALEAGAEDVADGGETWDVTSAPGDFGTVREALEKLGGKVEGALQLIPTTTVKVSGKEAESVLRLVGALDEHDDVQNVTENFEIDDAEMERLSK